MKIHSMTATFGKLENQTLTFQPGLNIIPRPNEWGKSTWCAFLVTMLYGLETKERTKKDSLAVKDRYAPWSGSPLSGRLDLEWDGRNITIERWTKGRTPMGEFWAYETESGVAMPELTATTCGEMLLGVERSVFLRSGFLRLTDMPVTEDESLRRRLNALVTTGDESGAADALGQKLKDLKNRCRSNRSNGLIPQAEAQRAELEDKMRQLRALQEENNQIEVRQQVLEEQTKQLENHRQALAYEAAQADLARIAQAQQARAQAEDAVQKAENACACLPPQQAAQQKLESLNLLSQEQLTLQAEAQHLPELPQKPQSPLRYAYTPPEQAVQEAQSDLDYVNQQNKIKIVNNRVALGYGIFAAGALLSLLIPPLRAVWLYICLAVVLGGIAVLALCALRTAKMRRDLERVYERHPGLGVDKWLAEAQAYADAHEAYLQKLDAAQAAHAAWNRRREALNARLAADTEGQPLSQAMAYYAKVLAQWNYLENAQRESRRSAAHAEALAQMAKPVPPPAEPDALTLSLQQTEDLLTDTAYECKRLHTRLNQNMGKMEALGREEGLHQLLDAVNARLERLTETYGALELALQTLSDAAAQLQRRFAPRIAQGAQNLLCRMTGGRYTRLSIAQDLSLTAGAEDETVQREAQRRSDGTVDQIYLALRLAVSKELTPHAPLVLDDALVRFDDERHAAAMKILKEEAENRQIILFTCQSREVQS